jgi:hypothetical protein
MPSFRCLCILLIFAVPSSSDVNGQDKDKAVNFPTDDEIRLVLTQADRAIGQYKPLLDQEEKMLGKVGAEAVARDREVVDVLCAGRLLQGRILVSSECAGANDNSCTTCDYQRLKEFR